MDDGDIDGAVSSPAAHILGGGGSVKKLKIKKLKTLYASKYQKQNDYSVTLKK